MRMVAGFVAAQCVTFAWLVFLSLPAEPTPPLPDAATRARDDEPSITEVRELRERVRSLESLLATLQSDRTPAPVASTPSPASSSPPFTAAGNVGEQDLEVRAQQPVDWMALERFAGLWDGKDGERSESMLALVGPADLKTQFGPPSKVEQAGDSLVWVYESAERNAAGESLTRIQFLVSHGCVLAVNRSSNP